MTLNFLTKYFYILDHKAVHFLLSKKQGTYTYPQNQQLKAMEVGTLLETTDLNNTKTKTCKLCLVCNQCTTAKQNGKLYNVVNSLHI